MGGFGNLYRADLILRLGLLSSSLRQSDLQVVFGEESGENSVAGVGSSHLVARSSAPFFRFGPYESHPKTQELLKHGVRLKVRPQPLRLLNLLLEKPGEVLTREEIRQQLWSAETFVDFEHSLNTAVMVLRGVLNDSAAEPVYIETLPRVGYRFIAEVSVMNEKAAATAEQAGGGDGAGEASREKLETEAPDSLESEP